MVGFDPNGIGWTADALDAERAFVLAAIDGACQRRRGDAPTYHPPFARAQPEEHVALVLAYDASFVEPGRRWYWRVEPGLPCALHCPPRRLARGQPCDLQRGAT